MLTLQDIHWSLPAGEAVVKGVSLTVSPGRLTVITGPNGGGKTSLARLIAGLIQPDAGRIWLAGQDITGWDITQRARAGIAYAFQQPVRFKGLTVADLLSLAAGEAISEESMCRVLGKVGLCAQEYLGRSLDGGLSGGESKRVEIASVLARQGAKVLIFDEPEAGIDLWSFSSLVETFQQLKREQSEALLVISHQERILEIADEIVVIADGRIRTAGSRDEVLPTLFTEEKRSRCPLGRPAAAEGGQYYA